MRRDQRSREKLLEAAARLFHHRGFQPTSLDDILVKSGVCRSNFYYHFRSKEGLGLEVLAQEAERFDAQVIRGILEDKRESPRRRLELLFEVVAARQRLSAYRNGCPFGNLAAELCGIHGEFQTRLSAFFGRWEVSVERCLREGVARGEFRSDLNTRRVATALVSQIEGATLLTKTHGHGGPIDAAAHAMLTLLERR
jgi:TetR/AcrR family transcriptional regulator, transcriptional repressor for nem operon